jgi:hypothetical protein
MIESWMHGLGSPVMAMSTRAVSPLAQGTVLDLRRTKDKLLHEVGTVIRPRERFLGQTHTLDGVGVAIYIDMRLITITRLGLDLTCQTIQD